MRPNERNCQNCTEARSFYLKPVLLGCLQIKGEQPHKKQSLGFCMVVLVGWESIEPAVSKKKFMGVLLVIMIAGCWQRGHLEKQDVLVKLLC
jgi:hypothetical protein